MTATVAIKLGEGLNVSFMAAAVLLAVKHRFKLAIYTDTNNSALAILRCKLFCVKSVKAILVL